MAAVVEAVLLAECHRIRGICLVRGAEPSPAKAELEFLRAVELAHDQGALAFEIRADCELVRLWRAQAPESANSSSGAGRDASPKGRASQRCCRTSEGPYAGVPTSIGCFAQNAMSASATAFGFMN